MWEIKKKLVGITILVSMTVNSQTCPTTNIFLSGDGGGVHTFNYSALENLIIDLDYIDNSCAIEINGIRIHPRVMQMESAYSSSDVVMMVFENGQEIESPWLANENGLPRMKLEINNLGNVLISGSRYINSVSLEPMMTGDGSSYNVVQVLLDTNTITIINPDDGGIDGISGSILTNEICNTDTQSPSSPNVTSTDKTDTTADLSWSGATDNAAVTGYKVYTYGTLTATLGNVTNYKVIGLSPSTSYAFSVRAVDAAGNESVDSNSVPVTTDTNSGSDSQAPTTPTLTENGKTDTTIDLTWNGASDNVGVTNYRVYSNNSLIETLGNVSLYQATGLNRSYRV
ncbi:fibronectin type III domain-containing protein [uncultured Croceitalea sp.]|uniref:fibronectin type III domain-containing protein n=1 Tax=uncultured Croceitalea sp. TaxID=1798908 RepID=UPI00374E7CE0